MEISSLQGDLVCNRLLICSGMDITGKILYEYGKPTGSSFRILHRQYSTYALRKPVLTLYKSVLGTIEKRTSHFTIAPTTYLCVWGRTCAVRMWSIDWQCKTRILNPVCFLYSYRLFPVYHLLAALWLWWSPESSFDLLYLLLVV